TSGWPRSPTPAIARRNDRRNTVPERRCSHSPIMAAWTRASVALDYAAAERAIAAIVDAGIDVDILAERLQREGAGRVQRGLGRAPPAIEEKAGKPGTKRNR